MVKTNDLVVTSSFGGGTRPFKEYLLDYLEKVRKHRNEKEKSTKD